jgi:DNA polymerase-3 subunit alpha
MVEKFTHLHLHTEYSVLDSLTKIEEVVNKAKEFGMDSVAITDHGNLSGLLTFYAECKKSDVKPILGVESYIVPNMLVKEKVDGKSEQRNHIILLAKDNIGYKNLIKLTTESNVTGFYSKPRIDFDLLREHSNGIIVLTACIAGELPSIFKNQSLSTSEKERLANEFVDKYLEVFSDDFYIEIQSHNFEEEKRTYSELYKFAKKRNLKCVFTNDVHYLTKEDKNIHKALINSSAEAQKSDKQRSYPGGGYWFKSSEEIAAMGVPVELIRMTQEISEKINVDLNLNRMPKLKFEKDRDTNQFISKYCQDELKIRGLWNRQYAERLASELKVIKDLDFGDYFLIVKDYIDFAKKNKIPKGPGRGSAAGSLAVFLLGITEIDPIIHDLKFSRFLNYSRKEFPDIDTDFSKDRRDEIFKYLKDKYGDEKCAKIATFGTLRPRGAVKAIARTLGIDFDTANSITAAMDDKADDILPNRVLDNADFILDDYRMKYPQLFNDADRLKGHIQNEGVHACGIIISDEPIIELAPLKRSKGGLELVMQWDYNSLKYQKFLIKFDVLGLKNLDIIHNAIELIKERHGVDIDFSKISLDDKETYKNIRSGYAVGIFQIESYSMRRLAKEMKIENFNELTALLAINRPGPLQAGLDKMYINNKFNKDNMNVRHEMMKGILKDTYGVIIYQEDVMNIAMKMAGMSEIETDDIRKAISKKDAALLGSIEDKFVSGCIKNSIEKETSEQIWKDILEFAGYSFNLSHAVSYAVLSYRTAWLKAHYPIEYIATLYNYTEEAKIKDVINETNRLGIPCVRPHVNTSKSDFYVGKDNKIYYGLKLLKGIGEESAKIIQMCGPYESYDDFLVKTGRYSQINKTVVAVLEDQECFSGLKKTVQQAMF